MIRELNDASNSLAAAAETIQRANPAWAAGVINSIIVANNIVVGILERGGRAVERYNAKHGPQAGQDDESTEAGQDDPHSEQNIAPVKD